MLKPQAEEKTFHQALGFSLRFSMLLAALVAALTPFCSVLFTVAGSILGMCFAIFWFSLYSTQHLLARNFVGESGLECKRFCEV